MRWGRRPLGLVAGAVAWLAVAQPSPVLAIEGPAAPAAGHAAPATGQAEQLSRGAVSQPPRRTAATPPSRGTPPSSPTGAPFSVTGAETAQALRVVLGLTLLAILPALLMSITSFLRIIIVLSMLRTAARSRPGSANRWQRSHTPATSACRASTPARRFTSPI